MQILVEVIHSCWVLVQPDLLIFCCSVHVGSDAIPVTPAGLGSQKIVRIKTDIVYWEDIKDAEYYEINGMRLEPFQEPYKRGMGKREAVVVAFLSTTEASEEEND